MLVEEAKRRRFVTVAAVIAVAGAAVSVGWRPSP